MDDSRFISSAEALPTPFTTICEAPSNIALIKYWGKSAPQLPKNTSLSFTLDSSITRTALNFTPQKSTSFSFELYFVGVLKPEFNPKLEAYFNQIRAYIPWIENYHLLIKSQNSFPHSSGIASSASAMAALSVGLMEMERKLTPSLSETACSEKASFLARLGSGSAARSIEGPLMLWGKTEYLKKSSDYYAIPLKADINPVFTTYQDTILLVDKGSKPVSSTQGHQLMHKHPYAAQRFKQAKNHLKELMPILKSGDLAGFMQIVESEALSLHAMMMTSKPYYLLMKPNTLAVIEKVWNFRKETRIPLCFTLDAGANIHLLYPLADKKAVLELVESDLKNYCNQGDYLIDQVGRGAKKV